MDLRAWKQSARESFSFCLVIFLSIDLLSVICQPCVYDEWQRDWQANSFIQHSSVI